MQKKKRKFNLFVVFNSIIALGFLALAFIKSSWLYIIPPVVLMILNQRKLMK